MKKIWSLLLVCLLGLWGRAAYAEASYTQIDQETAKEMMRRDDGHVVVDVRRQDEYDAGHIPGAILIPNESIGADMPEALPDYDQIILIYCRSGNRSKQAAQKLADMGYTRLYEFGGIIDWTGEVVTTEEERTAELRFSSFAGGGYEYSVRAEDPSVVRCEARYEYEPHAEELDGASFDYIVSLSGLRPGSTAVTVYGRSPILENENSVYSVSVDEALRVTVTPVRTISYLFAHRTGEMSYDAYEITMDEEGWHLSVNEEPVRPFGAEQAEALARVIETYDVVSWNGFSRSREDMLDGESFVLEFALTDGTRVRAVGDNVFPEHYYEAIGEMWEILEDWKQS